LKPRALVVDDDVGILQMVRDILDSLNHYCDLAGDQGTAWKLFEARHYDYVLLDLEIPVEPGRLFRKENGMNLLKQISGHPAKNGVPVIVMTGHGKDSPDLAVSLMRPNGAKDFVTKPFDKGNLDEAIRRVLAKGGQDAPTPQVEPKIKGPTPFKAEKREMVIYDDRVTLCGIQVWTDCAFPETGLILRKLSERTHDGYVRIKGPKLNKDLGRDISNPVSKFIKRFRENCRSKMASCLGLDCGMHDVIGDPKRGGGYHLTETIEIRIEDGEERTVEQPCSMQVEHPLNERQQWILDQIRQGFRIGQKDAVAHFFGERTETTIKRDLKALRGRGLIFTDRDGCYSLCT
jgi:DNA-binding response OmpR family regulator